MPASELNDFFERTRTREDEELMLASLRAEGDNDPKAALDLYLQAAHLIGAPHERDLRELVRLGPTAPSWAIARWVVVQADLWMLLTHDPRVDDAARLTMAAAYPEIAELDPRGIGDLGTAIAACDWMYKQLVLYEMSGLADYIDVVAGDRLLERVPFVSSWPAVELGVYRYESVVGDRMRVVDLATGEPVELLHVGCLTGAAPGQHVLGRIVPIADAPGLMFARRPLAVDEETAGVALVRGDTELLPGWLAAVSQGVYEGRLPSRLGMVRPTPLTSDVTYDPWEIMMSAGHAGTSQAAYPPPG